MDRHQQQTYSNDPEVVPESNLETVPYRLAESGPQKEQYTASGQQYDTRHGAPVWDSSLKDAPKIGNWKTRLILIGSAILIAIVSGVIGGIVGWQVTENRLSGRVASTEGDVGSTSTDTESDTSSSSSSGSGRTCATNGNLTSASVVRNGTSLAATGWRYGNQHVIWLYFQGTDDTLQYVVYDTMYGTWAGPTMLSVEDGAVGGTALTATTLLWARSTGAPPEPQPQLVYQDTSGTLKGVAWYVIVDAKGGGKRKRMGRKTIADLIQETWLAFRRCWYPSGRRRLLSNRRERTCRPCPRFLPPVRQRLRSRDNSQREIYGPQDAAHLTGIRHTAVGCPAYKEPYG